MNRGKESTYDSTGVSMMVGKTISHYKILEKLGEGGMGVVYKAEDTRLKRTVALKFLPHNLESHESERARFLQEAQAASALNHPNVCTIYDIGEDQGEQFIAMEYVDGVTLREKMAEGKLQTSTAVAYAIQVGEALEEAHGKGIVHRDIKAENIMVTRKNQVKVMDFGLAKLKGSLKLTKTSSTVGTLAYMAPEQIQGGQVDARNDIFSFGVVLYEMLTRHLPFRGEHEAAMMYSILNEEPVSLQTHLPDAPSELLHTVARALEKDPEERYQTVHEMLIDLRRLKKESGRVVRPSAEMLPAEAAPPAGITGARRYSKKARWIAAGVVAILVAIIGWIIFRPGERGAVPGGEAIAKSIAVMYFENRTGEKDLDRVLVDMLITNLGRNKLITVVSGQRLFDVLKSMGKQDVAIDRSTATEAAKLAGAKTMLLGSIWSVGGKLNVTGQLLDVESGSVINSDRVEASKAEEVFAVADRFTEKVNEWLRGSPTEALRVADATTASYDAYRYYEQGMRHIYCFEFPEAGKSFAEAIRIDSTFAMAHLRLSMVQGSFQIFNPFPSRSLTLARESASRAERYARGLSEREKGLVDGWSALLRRDYDASEGTVAKLLARFPEDKFVLSLSAWSSFAKGMLDESNRALERSIEVDPSHSNAYNQLAYGYCRVGQYEKAFAAIRTYMALIPDAWNPYDSGCDVYMMAGRFDEALKTAEEGLKRVPSWTDSFDRQAQVYLLMHEPEKARERVSRLAAVAPESREYAERRKSISYSFEGRMRESVEVLRSSVERTRAKGDKTEELMARFYLARMLQEENRVDDALKELEAAKLLSREVRPDPSNPWPVRCDYYAGLALAGRGDHERAEALGSAIRSAAETTNGDPTYLSVSNGLMAEILLSQRKPKQALSCLERILPWMRMQFPRIRMLDARLSAELGDTKRAPQLLDGFRNCTQAEGAEVGGDFLDFWIEQSKLDYYEGRMHEHFGEKAEAVSSYQKSLRNWQNADKDYAPCVDARQRLTNLMK